MAAEQAVRHLKSENKTEAISLYYHQLVIFFGTMLIIVTLTALSIIYRQSRKLHHAYLTLSGRIRQSIHSDHQPHDRQVLLHDNSKEIIHDLEKQILDNKIYLDNKLTIPDLARILNTNKTYLSRLINEQHNTNFCDFINQLRIREACRLLVETGTSRHSLEQLGESVGFNSKSTFYNAFKKITGMSPSVFLKTLPKSNFPTERQKTATKFRK